MKHTLIKILPIIVFVLLHAVIVAQNVQGTPTGNERIQSTKPDFEKEVVSLVNIERKKAGVAPVRMDKLLAFAARYHAKDLAVNDYFMHATFYFDSSGEWNYYCDAAMRRKLFTGSRYGAENILAGINANETPEEAVEAWMESFGHKKNIIDPTWKFIGVGYYLHGERHCWVQDFQ